MFKKLLAFPFSPLFNAAKFLVRIHLQNKILLKTNGINKGATLIAIKSTYQYCFAQEFACLYEILFTCLRFYHYNQYHIVTYRYVFKCSKAILGKIYSTYFSLTFLWTSELN